jgi:hypothetical protein
MKTIILPGYSLKNKKWAESTKKTLEKHSPTLVYSWVHWKTGKSEEKWIEKEAVRVANIINGEKVNLLAKSIGTAVAMVVVKSKTKMINKVVLCGIPINDFMKGDEKYYNMLKNYPERDIIIFQNENDNHGSLVDTQKLINTINPKIKIIAKPRDDHEYPYIEDFLKLLK